MTAKRLVLAMMGILAMTALPAHASFVFSDITAWVGSGPNEAALVIDWNDALSPQAMAWGYRWSGTSTNIDLFTAIVQADPNLYAKVDAVGLYGLPVYGIGYDRNGNGFGITGSPTPTFTNGFYQTTDSNADGHTATDSADHYQEGWFSDGFWTSFSSTNGDPLGTNGPYSGGSWSTNYGLDGSALTNGAWFGLSFDPTYSFSDVPVEPVAAVLPEPASLTLLSLGAALLLRRRR